MDNVFMFWRLLLQLLKTSRILQYCYWISKKPMIEWIGIYWKALCLGWDLLKRGLKESRVCIEMLIVKCY